MHVIFVEHSTSTYVHLNPRLRWMGHWGAPTCKPTRLFGTAFLTQANWGTKREIERVESISSTAWPRLWFPLMYRRMTKALRQKLGKGKLVTIRKKKLGGGWTVCAS